MRDAIKKIIFLYSFRVLFYFDSLRSLFYTLLPLYVAALTPFFFLLSASENAKKNAKCINGLLFYAQHLIKKLCKCF